MKIYSPEEHAAFQERIKDWGDKIIRENPGLDDPNVSDEVLDDRYNLLLIQALDKHDKDTLRWFLSQVEDEIIGGNA